MDLQSSGIDPQKLLFLDKRVVYTIRSAGLIFSVSLAIICVLVYVGVLVIPGVFLWACLPLAGLLLVLGILEAFWNPYTQAKVSIYITMYMALGGPLSVLVLGFSTLVFLAWTILIMITVIFFGLQRAAIGYLIMLVSLMIWLMIHAHEMGLMVRLGYGVSQLSVGLLCLLVFNVWRFANETVNKMEIAHEKEDFEHSQLTSMINSMADGVLAVDTHGKIILYNAAVLNLLDRNSTMQGKPLAEFMSLYDEQDAAVDVQALVLACKTPTVYRNYRIKYGDDSFANMYLSIAPVHLGYGKAGGQEGYVLIIRDITREKSLEEERDEFISVVSHELRTPIAITEGEISNAQLILHKSDDRTKAETALEGAHNQVLFLADMINDLSTLSRAERGVLEVEVTEIAISDFLDELLRDYTPDAEKKGLKLILKPSSKDVRLNSSQLYVKEVLQNFITNAIKYTEQGSVAIAAVPAKGGVEFRISDTGIGLSKQDKAKVFDKFFRSEDYRTRKNSGTGLGLYVTMKLARLLHAKITVDSKLNVGSTFTVFFPDLHSDKPKQ